MTFFLLRIYVFVLFSCRVTMGSIVFQTKQTIICKRVDLFRFCCAKFAQFGLFRVVKCIIISRRYLTNSGRSVAFELCIEEPSPLTKLSHKWNIEQYFQQLDFGFYKRHGKYCKDFGCLQFSMKNVLIFMILTKTIVGKHFTYAWLRGKK